MAVVPLKLLMRTILIMASHSFAAEEHTAGNVIFNSWIWGTAAYSELELLHEILPVPVFRSKNVGRSGKIES